MAEGDVLDSGIPDPAGTNLAARKAPGGSVLVMDKFMAQRMFETETGYVFGPDAIRGGVPFSTCRACTY